MYYNPCFRLAASLAAWLALTGSALSGASLQQEASAQGPAPSQETLVPQTALSLCPALEVVSREAVTPGTALAASMDGKFQVTYVHTTLGAEFTILNRDATEKKHINLAPPKLPPGVVWRIREVAFSPDNRWLAVASVGAIWIVDTTTAQVRLTVGMDAEKQTYPGQISWSESELAVVFWPPESYLADAETAKPVDFRIYNAESWQVIRRLELSVHSSDAWSELKLAPDGERIAVLERARRWPGKSQLLVFQTDKNKPLWQKKTDTEDLVWSDDGEQLLTLGSELTWLDVETGKTVRRAETKIDHSELQKLRTNEVAHAGLGQFSRYSPFERAVKGSKKRSEIAVLWRLDTGKELCQTSLGAATSLDAWLTGRGELLTLEETYEVRPPLRLLKFAQLVTYRIAPPAKPATPPPEKPAKP